MLGTTIGRYRIVGKLGEGGMGSVWKAEDTLLERTVALKFLAEALATSDSARERFLRGARSTSALNHPGIATLYEAGEADGRLYLAVEYVDGETLDERMARGRVPVSEAVRIAADAADALAHAHARGVIHRDISARNIMLARDGRVVVIDLGLALLGNTARITTTGTIFGTVAYLPPEVARGAASDARSDLYSLGVVLYEMLAGRRPFEGERGDLAALSEAAGRPEPPSAFCAGVPPALDRLVLRLIARDPARRPTSADDLARQLRALAPALAEGGAAGPVSPAPPAHKAASTAHPVSRRCVAILPFRGSGGSHAGKELADDALASGFAEALSASLARVRSLRVVPPSAIAGASAFEHDPRAAARELGAHLLLQGAVRRSGERLRVAYSLVETRRGVQVAGDNLDGPASDLFGLEDALVASVARALRIETAARPRDIGARGPRADAAHEKYLRALGLLQRNDNEAMVDGAIRLLEELREEEGDTALVHAALGRAYVARLGLAFDESARAKAEASCRIALELDPHSPDVLVTLGRLHFKAGRYQESVDTLRRSLELQAQNPEALLFLSRAQQALGRYDEARAAAEEAIALRPGQWSGYDRLGMVHFARGEFARALDPWRKVVELTPDNSLEHSNLGAAYFQLGRLQEALASFERSNGVLPNATASFGAGTVLFFEGRMREAVEMFQRAVRLSPRDARAWGNLGDAQRWSEGLEPESRASFDRAIALVQEQLAANPNDPENWARLALWLAKRGRTPESRTALQRATALAPEHPGVLGRAVTVELLAGDTAHARATLARALERGYSWIELTRDPELEALREDPDTRQMLLEIETARLASIANGVPPGEGP